MEAIKFSELPSGDRMQLQDEDGLPIIANQENRLLSWGRLKAQLAVQTHTKTVEDDDNKVPTAKAVLAAVTNAQNQIAEHLATAKTELTQQVNSLRDDLDEQIDEALGKAEGADATAKSALASAGAASRDAQSAENKAVEALAQIKEVKTTADTALTAANETKAEVATTNETATTAQTVANEAKAIAESATAKAEEALAKATETPVIDLTPITERLDTIESKDTTQDGRLDAVESKNTAQDGRLDTLEAKTESQDSEIGALVSATATAQATAEAAQTTASEAKELASHPSTPQVFILNKAYEFQIDADSDTGAPKITGYGESSASSTPTATDLNVALETIINNQQVFYRALCVLTKLVNAHENFNDDLQADLATFMTELNAQMSLVAGSY